METFTVKIEGTKNFNQKQQELLSRFIAESLKNMVPLYEEIIDSFTKEEEFEKPQHPEDVILVDNYLVNANVTLPVSPVLSKMVKSTTRNLTWLIQLPRVKNHSDTIRMNTAGRLIAERYGNRISNMEIINLKLENYVPVEIPGSLFFNTTLE